MNNILFLVLGFMIGAGMITIAFGQSISIDEFYSDVSDPNFTRNTYETICKGYYYREVTPTKIIYTGFGDLGDKYTYEEIIPIKSPGVPSSTPDTRGNNI